MSLSCASGGNADYSVTSPSNTKKSRLLVDNFEYIGPPQHKWLIPGIQSTTTNGLAKLSQFEVTGVAEQRKAAKLIQQRQMVGEEVDATAELARINSVDYSCTGTVQATGKDLMVNVRIVEAPTNNVKQSSNLKGTIDNPFDVQEKIVDNLIASLDVKLNENDKLLLTSTMTKNEEAFSLYSKALEVLMTEPKKSAVFLANALAKDPEYLDALEDLSGALYQMGDYKRAMEYMNRKKVTLEKKKLTETADYANTLCNMGMIHLNLGDSDKALLFCKQDKALKEKLSLTKSKIYANTLLSISAIFLSQRQIEKAIVEVESAKQIYESLGLNQSHEFGDVLISAGVAYKVKGDFEKANSYYANAEYLYRTLGLTKTTSYATVLSNQGLIHLAKKEYKEALKKFISDKEIQDNLQMTNTEEYAVTLGNLALIFSELGETTKAKEFLAQVQKIRKSKK